MKKTFKSFCTLLLLPLFLIQAGAEKNITELMFSKENPGVEISETMYGVFFEDINYAGDGGLYPELIRNRSFEYRTVETGIPSPLNGWIINAGRRGEGEAIPMSDNPINNSNTAYLRIDVTKAPFALMNFGYTGGQDPDIYIADNAEYKLVFYIRNVSFNGSVDFLLTDKSGNQYGETYTCLPENKDWEKREFIFKSEKEGKTRLEIVLDGTGIIELDYISLMPTNTWGYGSEEWKYGGLRKDLVEAIATLNPGFIRFPGGCIVEGAYRHETHYNWKDSIGSPEERRENINLWGYGMTYGLGYHEYFQLCEDLGAVAVPVLHAGILCQPRNNGSNTEADWKPGDAEFDGLIQDYLDLIEYANGGTDTLYGKLRAENGHPEPFNMTMLGIGNENWGEQYWRNFKAIKEVINEKYPEIAIITTSGPLSSGWINDMTWSQVRANYPDVIVDEHYYEKPEWFLNNTKRYDSYSRSSAKIFLGEYAAHEDVSGGKRPNTVYSAVCEAAYITGLERNADIVIMSSYAPLMAKSGMQQWTPDMIWFNSKEINQVTPNYYVQKLFSNRTGNRTLKPEQEPVDIYQSTSVNEDESLIYTKLVNAGAESCMIKLSFNDFNGINKTAILESISGKKSDTRAELKTIEIEMIETINSEIGFYELELPPYCAAVLTVSYGGEINAINIDKNDNLINSEISDNSEISSNNTQLNESYNIFDVIIVIVILLIVLVVVIVAYKCILNVKKRK